MIPKKIHYCWFGGKSLPEDAEACIASWKKYCPDYEIIEWNENTFDINSIVYVKEAAESKKWAFITDYVRLYAMYNYGGIYMDTDVEVLKNLDVFLQDKGFSGYEDYNRIPTGIMAAEKGLPFIKKLLDYYNDKHFIVDGKMDMTTNVEIITNICLERGIVLNNQLCEIDGFKFYPKDFFCPKDCQTLELKVTDNTYTIHHFAGSWTGRSTKFKKIIKKILGPYLCNLILKLGGRK